MKKYSQFLNQNIEEKISSFFSKFIAPIIGFLIVIIGIPYLIFTIVDWGFMYSEITAYPVSCIEMRELECVKRRSDPPITFKINTQEQYVVMDINHDLKKLKGCVIRNRKNWQCEAENQYFSGFMEVLLGFKNGKYFGPDESLMVSRFQWSIFR